MFGAGVAALFLSAYKMKSLNSFYPVGLFPFITTATVQATNLKLFLIFLKVGAVLYGSGYALFAFLDAELVAKGFLSRQQLMDAIAVGQFTPGPVFSSVTFIGYQINGFWGAVVSTLGIFLPSFAFVALLGHILKKVQSSPLFRAFLDAVNVASVAIIIAVCYVM